LKLFVTTLMRHSIQKAVYVPVGYMKYLFSMDR